MPVDVLTKTNPIKTVKNLLISMRDGTRLAGDLYLPDVEGKVPVVLKEYCPYRKDEDTDMSFHRYFASHGIATIRVDVRGTGESEGFITDEYAKTEIKDGFEVIEWLARQDWCNGNVGMTGGSYGGYSTLAVAMLQPPSLKAIVSIMGTDDRFSDGDQYRGGAKRGLISTATYPTFMVAMNALPPYPEYAKENWAGMWQERLEKNTPWVLEWVGRQVDDEYWQECLGRRWRQVKCPAFMIGGWNDHFVNSMTRLYAELHVPKKLLMGPWGHHRPSSTAPGPRIDYLREMLKWFAYWLKGEDTGIMDEPPVTIYVQQYEKPKRIRDIVKGFWRNEDAWPPSRAQKTIMYLNGEKLSPSSPESPDGQRSYEYNPIVGLGGGPWYGGFPWILNADQREEDALSVCYDTAPLNKEVEIAGWPHAVLNVSSTADVAFFVARLEDVAPDGASALVTKGVLNGTRRRGLAYADPMVPSEIYELDIQLDATAWIFEPGHRVQLAICSSDWPDIWPSPKKAVNTVHSNAEHPSRLVLPVVTEQKPRLPEPSLLSPPEAGPTMRLTDRSWRVVRDIYEKVSGIETMQKRRIGGELSNLIWISEGAAYASEVEPGDVFVRARERMVLELGGMIVESTGSCLTKSTSDNFHVTVNLDVKLNGAPHFSRRWTKSVLRNLL